MSIEKLREQSFEREESPIERANVASVAALCEKCGLKDMGDLNDPVVRREVSLCVEKEKLAIIEQHPELGAVLLEIGGFGKHGRMAA